jgi:hypothetical protein
VKFIATFSGRLKDTADACKPQTLAIEADSEEMATVQVFVLYENIKYLDVCYDIEVEEETK